MDAGAVRPQHGTAGDSGPEGVCGGWRALHDATAKGSLLQLDPLGREPTRLERERVVKKALNDECFCLGVPFRQDGKAPLALGRRSPVRLPHASPPTHLPKPRPATTVTTTPTHAPTTAASQRPQSEYRSPPKS